MTDKTRKVKNPLHSYSVKTFIDGEWVELTRQIAGLENDPDELLTWEDAMFVDDGELLDIMEKQGLIAVQICYHPGGVLKAGSFDGGYVVRAPSLEPTYYDECESDEFARWCDDVAHLTYRNPNMNKLLAAKVAIANLVKSLNEIGEPALNPIIAKIEDARDNVKELLQ